MADYLPKILHNGELIDFIPKEHIKAIERETNLTREQATEVSEEVQRFFIKNYIKITTKPMIRETTCSIKIQLGYIKARHKTTRIGFPFYDLRTKFFDIDMPEDVRMRLIYEHVKQEYEAVKVLIERCDVDE